MKLADAWKANDAVNAANYLCQSLYSLNLNSAKATHEYQTSNLSGEDLVRKIISRPLCLGRSGRSLRGRTSRLNGQRASRAKKQRRIH